MCDLIQNLHSSRMCFGDFNYETLVLLNSSDITSVRINSAKNMSFWLDSHGEFKSEDRSSPGTNVPLTASRRIHAKQATCRYDDFESLLYLLLTLQGKILPWDGSSSIKDFNDNKNQFLKDPLLYVKTDDSISILCDLILFAEYDERPLYNRITQLMLNLCIF